MIKKFYSFIVIVFLQCFSINDITTFSDKKNIDSDLVKSVLNEIKLLHLDNFLNNFLLDISLLIMQVKLFLQNIKQDGFNLENKTKEELILQYKKSSALMSYFYNFNLLSDRNKENIIFFILLSFESIVSNESELNKFLNNESIANLLFFATAMGIKFTCIDDLKNIIILIKSRCNHLDSKDIEDFKYQDNLYEILMQLSIEINKNNFFGKIISKFFEESIKILKDKIETAPINKKKITDKKKK